MPSKPSGDDSDYNFSPDGQTLVSAHEEGVLLFRRVGTWEIIRSLQAHHDTVLPLAFRGTGDVLATGSRCLEGGRAYGEIKLWRMPAAELALTLVGHDGLVTALAFSPSSATRPASVSGPRELLMITSYPAARLSRATVLPMFPLPMKPTVVIEAATPARRRSFRGGHSRHFGDCLAERVMT